MTSVAKGAGAALIVAVLAPTAAGAAQPYPSKAIRLVAPYPVGGSVDALARVIAPRITENTGQPVVVDNRGGAGGIIGTTIVVKAPGDGYTALIVFDTFAVNPHVYKDLPYDIFRDLAPVSQLMAAPMFMVVNPKFPAETLQDFVALARAKPGYVKYGSGSTGSSSHLTPELFKSVTGTDLLHVPYKGAGPALTAVLTGDAHLLALTPIVAVPLVKAGRLRALAVTSAKRAPQLPSVPTVAESGYPGFDANAWYGLLVPGTTPPAIVRQVREVFAGAMRRQDLAAQLAEQGGEVVLTTPEQFGAFLRSESARWGKVIREARISAN